jgi:hypothetical protein
LPWVAGWLACEQVHRSDPRNTQLSRPPAPASVNRSFWKKKSAVNSFLSGILQIAAARNPQCEMR